MLSSKKIESYLSGAANGLRVQTYGCVSSTNDIIKELAKDNAEILVVATEQTAGRGRRGRSFFSPKGTGLYMSILLRPEASPELSALITTAAAVATARAIEKNAGVKADIKWINDVYINGKKACGILCESKLSPENSLEYIIVGIGINLCHPKDDFPEEIRDIATSVFGKRTPDEDTVCHLCADIVNGLFEYTDDISSRAFLEEYKSRLFMLGKEITVITPNETYLATASDIDSDAHLTVTLQDGEKRTLSAGEISIRATN